MWKENVVKNVLGHDFYSVQLQSKPDGLPKLIGLQRMRSIVTTFNCSQFCNQPLIIFRNDRIEMQHQT